MEGLGLQRAWLDEEEEEASRFSDTKSGAQTQVIGTRRHRVAARSAKCEIALLFCRPIGARAILSVWSACWIASVKRLVWPTSRRTPCATPLRHTFASLAGDLGFSELTIAALLGHSARGVTQRYIHIDEAFRMTAVPPAGSGTPDRSLPSDGGSEKTFSYHDVMMAPVSPATPCRGT